MYVELYNKNLMKHWLISIANFKLQKIRLICIVMQWGWMSCFIHAQQYVPTQSNTVPNSQINFVRNLTSTPTINVNVQARTPVNHEMDAVKAINQRVQHQEEEYRKYMIAYSEALGKENWIGAAELLKSAFESKSYGPSDDDLVKVADLYFKGGDYENAVMIYKKAMASYFRNREYDKIIAITTRISTKYLDDYILSYIAFGKVVSGDSKNGILIIDSLIANTPPKIKSFSALLMGDYYTQCSDYRNGLKYYKLGYPYCMKKDMLGLRIAEVCYEMSEYDECIETINNMMANESFRLSYLSAYAYYLRGKAKYMKGEIKDAKTDLKKAKKMGSDDARAFLKENN